MLTRRRTWLIVQACAGGTIIEQMEIPDNTAFPQLWLGDYEVAWNFLQEAIPKLDASYDLFIGLAGVARWCLDGPLEAVRTWKKGLKTDYTVGGAGGVRMPILLLAAAFLRPELQTLGPAKQAFNEARKVLNIRVEKPRAKMYWPGPLGRYMLGQNNTAALREIATEPEYPRETPINHYQTDFYEGVVELSQGHRDRFAELMQRMVARVEQNTADPKIFPSYLRMEEFFIARHELYRLRGVPDTGPGATGPIPHPGSQP